VQFPPSSLLRRIGLGGCVSMIELLTILMKYRFFIPRLEDILDSLASLVGSSWFSKIGLCGG